MKKQRTAELIRATLIIGIVSGVINIALGLIFGLFIDIALLPPMLDLLYWLALFITSYTLVWLFYMVHCKIKKKAKIFYNFFNWFAIAIMSVISIFLLKGILFFCEIPTAESEYSDVFATITAAISGLIGITKSAYVYFKGKH